jgi:hypothetical protein
VSDQTVLEAVVLALQKAAEYDKNDQSAPTAVLWPDKNHEWEPLVGRLQSRLPLLAFGAHEQGAWKGPAIWLRCALAGEIGGVTFDDGATPIVYLPGVGRDELRSLEDMNPLLQPIAELQYRGRTGRTRMDGTGPSPGSFATRRRAWGSTSRTMRPRWRHSPVL